MSDQSAAVHHPTVLQMTDPETKALARQLPQEPPMRSAGNLFPSLATLELCEKIAEYVVSSQEFAKRFNSGRGDAKAKVVMTLLKADSLGVSFTDALEHVYVVDGKTGLSGQLMLRLINERAPGRTFKVLESTDKVCRILLGRPGEEPQEFTFTVERAQQAGLLHYWKDGEKKEQFVWKAYREEMLQWRAIAKGARLLFPELLQGCYLLDELTSGPDLADPHAADLAVHQQHAERPRSQRGNGNGNGNGNKRSKQKKQESKPKPDPDKELVKNLLNTATGLTLEADGHVPNKDDWSDRFKAVRHRMMDEMFSDVLGHVPEGEPELSPKHVEAMRQWVKARRRDAILDLVCRLALIADGKDPQRDTWADHMKTTRATTWEQMCKDIIGQPAEPDAPLAEAIIDQMVDALTEILKQLRARSNGS